ncbi:MAG: hypothetical protein ACO29O_05965 [Chitinophagaceae bacterium]
MALRFLSYSLICCIVFGQELFAQEQRASYMDLITDGVVNSGIDCRKKWSEISEKLVLTRARYIDRTITDYIYQLYGGMDDCSKRHKIYKVTNKEFNYFFGLDFEDAFICLKEDLMQNEINSGGEISIVFFKYTTDKDKIKFFREKLRSNIYYELRDEIATASTDEKIIFQKTKTSINFSALSKIGLATQIALPFSKTFWYTSSRMDEFTEQFRSFDSIAYYGGINFGDDLSPYINGVKYKPGYGYPSTVADFANFFDYKFDDGYMIDNEGEVAILFVKSGPPDIVFKLRSYFELQFGKSRCYSDEEARFLWWGKKLTVDLKYDVVLKQARMYIYRD